MGRGSVLACRWRGCAVCGAEGDDVSEGKITQAHVDLASLCGYISAVYAEGPDKHQWGMIQKRAREILDKLSGDEIEITGSPITLHQFEPQL